MLGGRGSKELHWSGRRSLGFYAPEICLRLVSSMGFVYSLIHLWLCTVCIMNLLCSRISWMPFGCHLLVLDHVHSGPTLNEMMIYYLGLKVAQPRDKNKQHRLSWL